MAKSSFKLEHRLSYNNICVPFQVQQQHFVHM
ncbi:hypothetical protein V6Z11_D11G333000 [Gossypium hirsutum]